MMRRLKLLLISLMPWMMLAGCGSLPKFPTVLIGGCPIPAEYDKVAKGPEDLPVVDTPALQHLRDDAKERGRHAVLAGDFNGLVGYVKRECQ
jgi:hypothetical protein